MQDYLLWLGDMTPSKRTIPFIQSSPAACTCVASTPEDGLTDPHWLGEIDQSVVIKPESSFNVSHHRQPTQPCICRQAILNFMIECICNASNNPSDSIGKTWYSFVTRIHVWWAPQLIAPTQHTHPCDFIYTLELVFFSRESKWHERLTNGPRPSLDRRSVKQSPFAIYKAGQSTEKRLKQGIWGRIQIKLNLSIAS